MSICWVVLYFLLEDKICMPTSLFEFDLGKYLVLASQNRRHLGSQQSEIKLSLAFVPIYPKLGQLDSSAS